MKEIKITFTDEEYMLYTEYAESKGYTIDEYIKELLRDNLEDEYDSRVILEYEDRCIAGEVSYIDLEDVNI